ncbi:MAG: hypothetical protein CM1200mP9_12040 [Gammaproteobacteria bacterium]|nr:MAG: hypothetical protein CM1200mP9_12040 [Gammaproteobacteria bacterium]
MRSPLIALILLLETAALAHEPTIVEACTQLVQDYAYSRIMTTLKVMPTYLPRTAFFIPWSTVRRPRCDSKTHAGQCWANDQARDE